MARHPRGEKKGIGTPATAALAASGVAHTVHAYSHADGETQFGAEAVAALGNDPDRVFKTLLADVGDRLVVGVVPVSGQLDLKALAAAVGAKRAAMADPSVAERSTGMVVGGISPLGQRTRLATVVDSSALAHATVFVSAGRRGLQVELSPADLVALTGATTAEIRRA